MDINTNNSAPTSGVAPQPQGTPSQDGQKKGLGNLKLDSKMIAIIAVVAVVVLVILIPAIARGVAEGKAKKAVKTYVQVFLSGDKDADDVKWKKFYPKDLEGEVEDWAEGYYDYIDDYDNFEDVEHYKVLSVTKLSGKEFDELLEDRVSSFFRGSQFSGFSGEEIEKRDIRDLKISKAYIVTTQFEYNRKSRVTQWLVIKVNGRYGVYDYDNIVIKWT